MGLCALVAVDLLQLYVPRLIKQAVDDLTTGAATADSLLRLSAVVVGLALGIVLLRMVWRPLLFGFSRAMERDLREMIFTRLQEMHLAYHDQNPPGEFMARATNDLNNIRMASGMGLVAAMDGLVMGLCAVGFMLYISPKLTLLSLIPMPLTVVCTRIFSKKMHRGFLMTQESFAAMTELVREALSAVALVKAYALAGRELARLKAAGRGYFDLNMNLARILGLFFPLMVLFTNLSLAVILGVGGPLTVFGRITPGDFVAFSAYLGMLTWPMMALGWVVSLMQRALGSLDRVDEVLFARPQVNDPVRPLSLDPGAGRGIEVKNLTFAYPDAARPALQNVTLNVAAGRTTALVGTIGSGKSTLLALLGRLYDPPRDTVRVEGVDVLDLTQADLRAHVVQVPQTAFVFSATVRANLSLGRPSAAESELWAALEIAELAQEVKELPQGLDTLLGERGLSLSGGQRQRLTLARALLLDPPVLVLDDPLSAVDTETEARILRNLDVRRPGRTTLMVSHRLASVAFAGFIYVLDQGRVTEQGDHAGLIQAGGLYQSLFSEQALLSELGG